MSDNTSKRDRMLEHVNAVAAKIAGMTSHSITHESRMARIQTQAGDCYFVSDPADGGNANWLHMTPEGQIEESQLDWTAGTDEVLAWVENVCPECGRWGHQGLWCSRCQQAQLDAEPADVSEDEFRIQHEKFRLAMIMKHAAFRLAGMTSNIADETTTSRLNQIPCALGVRTTRVPAVGDWILARNIKACPELDNAIGMVTEILPAGIRVNFPRLSLSDPQELILLPATDVVRYLGNPDDPALASVDPSVTYRFNGAALDVLHHATDQLSQYFTTDVIDNIENALLASDFYQGLNLIMSIINVDN